MNLPRIENECKGKCFYPPVPLQRRRRRLRVVLIEIFTSTFFKVKVEEEKEKEGLREIKQKKVFGEMYLKKEINIDKINKER